MAFGCENSSSIPAPLQIRPTSLLPTCFAQAPATRLRRFAQSAVEEAQLTGSLGAREIKRAGNMTRDNLKNSERDLHRLFRSLRLALPIRFSTFRFGLLYIHYLSLAAWFRYLLENQSEFLLGGFKADSYNEPGFQKADPFLHTP